MVAFPHKHPGSSVAYAPPVAAISNRRHSHLIDRATRRVVDLSCRDSKASVLADGPARRIVSALFGLESPMPLADAKLESVRRFCIFQRHDDRRRVSEAEALVTIHGYSPEQLLEICSIISREPGMARVWRSNTRELAA